MDRRVYMLMLIAFVVGMSELIVGGILDLIATDLHITISTAGLLITVFAFVFAISSPILLVTFARVERKKLIMLSLVVFFIGIMLAVVSTNFTMLLLSRILSAASGSVATVLSINLASRVVEPAYRGRAIGLVVMGISGSLVLGLPIGVFLGNFINWRAPFILTAFLTLLLFVGVHFTLQQVKPTQVVTLREQLATLKDHRVFLAHATTFFFLAGHFTFYGYLTPYVKETMNFDGLTISILYLCYGIAAVSGGGLAGVFADRFGNRKTLLSAIAILALSLFIMPFTTNLLILFWPILILWGIVSWGITPPIQSHLFQVAPETSDIQQSLNNAALQLGIAFGTLVGSFIIDYRSIAVTPHVGIGFVALSFIAAMITMRNRERGVREKGSI
ncbi:MAG TPA: MFS transporter [Pseudogracilibacillus sp.]|nr:MFS transporter [Pseudogracilibacillus sp.]